jgi:hypothetical protein
VVDVGAAGAPEPTAEFVVEDAEDAVAADECSQVLDEKRLDDIARSKISHDALLEPASRMTSVRSPHAGRLLRVRASYPPGVGLGIDPRLDVRGAVPDVAP